MDTTVELLSILDDNYVFCIRGVSDVCLVDPGEAQLCLNHLSKNKLDLKAILITHHHGDHIDGIAELKNAFPQARVYAPEKNKNQIPRVDIFVKDHTVIEAGGEAYGVMELPGHTLGILAYHDRKNHRLFSGDVIFGLGCGRLFEGTAEMMFQSLKKIAALAPETLIYCTHEYTATNVKFVEELIAQKKIPQSFNHHEFKNYKLKLDQLRSENKPSVPLRLGTELQLNPYLLCVQENNLESLRAIREARNHFRPK